MPGKIAQRIRRSLTQALAYAKRGARATDYRVHIPADINVKAIRKKLAVRRALGFSVNSRRHREQGKR
jgi:putative transcriptional regulator